MCVYMFSKSSFSVFRMSELAGRTKHGEHKKVLFVAQASKLKRVKGKASILRKNRNLKRAEILLYFVEFPGNQVMPKNTPTKKTV